MAGWGHLWFAEPASTKTHVSIPPRLAGTRSVVTAMMHQRLRKKSEAFHQMRAVSIHTRHQSSRHEALVRRAVLRATHKGLRKGFRSLQVAATAGREQQKTAAQRRRRQMAAAREVLGIAERHFLRSDGAASNQPQPTHATSLTQIPL